MERRLFRAYPGIDILTFVVQRYERNRWCPDEDTADHIGGHRTGLLRPPPRRTQVAFSRYWCRLLIECRMQEQFGEARPVLGEGERAEIARKKLCHRGDTLMLTKSFVHSVAARRGVRGTCRLWNFIRFRGRGTETVPPRNRAPQSPPAPPGHRRRLRLSTNPYVRHETPRRHAESMAIRPRPIRSSADDPATPPDSDGMPPTELYPRLPNTVDVRRMQTDTPDNGGQPPDRPHTFLWAKPQTHPDAPRQTGHAHRFRKPAPEPVFSFSPRWLDPWHRGKASGDTGRPCA